MSISILLADDHHVVRQGLRSLLEAQPDLRVVGEVADGLEAVQLAELVQPDVLVVDVTMPGMSGIQVTRQVRRRSPRTRVVVLSMHSDAAHVLAALRAGALAYVPKESTADELVDAVRAAASDRLYLSPLLPERAIAGYRHRAEPAGWDGHETLTTREREVLRLAVHGLSSAEIADRLSISPRTVETHRAHLMQKLGLRTQTDLIRYALKRGIVPM